MESHVHVIMESHGVTSHDAVESHVLAEMTSFHDAPLVSSFLFTFLFSLKLNYKMAANKKTTTTTAALPIVISDDYDSDYLQVDDLPPLSPLQKMFLTGSSISAGVKREYLSSFSSPPLKRKRCFSPLPSSPIEDIPSVCAVCGYGGCACPTTPIEKEDGCSLTQEIPHESQVLEKIDTLITTPWIIRKRDQPKKYISPALSLALEKKNDEDDIYEEPCENMDNNPSPSPCYSFIRCPQPRHGFSPIHLSSSPTLSQEEVDRLIRELPTSAAKALNNTAVYDADEESDIEVEEQPKCERCGDVYLNDNYQCPVCFY